MNASGRKLGQVTLRQTSTASTELDEQQSKVNKPLSTAEDDVVRTEDAAPPQWFLDPNGHRRSVWDLFLLSLVLYVCYELPLLLSMLPSPPPGLLVLDYFVDVVFAIDVVVNFRTGVVCRWGAVSYDPKMIARNYLRGNDYFSFLF